MTGKDIIEYITLNGYENFELVIRDGDKTIPVTDVWGLGGELNFESEEE